jgi:hypothetical protein
MPTPAMIQASLARTACQWGQASAVDPTASMEISQNIRLSIESVRPRMRIAIAEIV